VDLRGESVEVAFRGRVSIIVSRCWSKLPTLSFADLTRDLALAHSVEITLDSNYRLRHSDSQRVGFCTCASVLFSRISASIDAGAFFAEGRISKPTRMARGSKPFGGVYNDGERAKRASGLPGAILKATGQAEDRSGARAGIRTDYWVREAL
jgi:hypothetical protein